MVDGARRWIARAIAIAGLITVVVVAAVFIARRDDGSSGPVGDALRQAGAATDVWAGWTETRVSVGSKCRRVLIADDERERGQGLRQVDDLTPYDGMLFVSEGDSRAAFTMSRVPDALDITWYDAQGRPVGSTTMQPCPGTDASCPTYSAPEPYRYALERRGGEGEPGALGSC